MSEFIGDQDAYYHGYTDAVNYEPFNTNIYEFSDEGIEQYRAGYSKGMDRNLYHDNGIAKPLSEPSYQEVFG